MLLKKHPEKVPGTLLRHCVKITRKAFEETSLFNQETAQRFREEVLAVSGTADFMDMWVNFRGREPEIDPLLRNLGLQ